MSPRHTLRNSYGIVETDVAFVAGVVTKDFGRACGSPIVEVDDAGPPGGVVGVVVAVGIMPVAPFEVDGFVVAERRERGLKIAKPTNKTVVKP
jgi:hypothetical protein